MNKITIKFPSIAQAYFAVQHLSFAQTAIIETTIGEPEEMRIFAIRELNDIVSTICKSIEEEKVNEIDLETNNVCSFIQHLSFAQDMAINHILENETNEISTQAIKTINDIVMQTSEQLAKREMDLHMTIVN